MIEMDIGAGGGGATHAARRNLPTAIQDPSINLCLLRYRIPYTTAPVTRRRITIIIIQRDHVACCTSFHSLTITIKQSLRALIEYQGTKRERKLATNGAKDSRKSTERATKGQVATKRG